MTSISSNKTGDTALNYTAIFPNYKLMDHCRVNLIRGSRVARRISETRVRSTGRIPSKKRYDIPKINALDLQSVVLKKGKPIHKKMNTKSEL